MIWKRVFRVLVCLVLVCSLVFGIFSRFSMETEAVEVIMPALTPYFCYGVFAWLILSCSGQVFEEPDIQLIEDLGEGWEREIYNYDYGSSDSSEDDRDEDLENLRKLYSAIATALTNKGKITKDILANIATQLPVRFLQAFIFYLAHNGYFDTQPDVSVPYGFTSFNGAVIPTPRFTPELPYRLLYHNSECYWWVQSTAPLGIVLNSDLGSCRFKTLSGSTMMLCDGIYDRTVNSWDAVTMSWPDDIPYVGTVQTVSAGTQSRYWGEWIWSNYDVYNYADLNELVYSASSGYVSSRDDLIEPTIVYGSIAEAIQNDEATVDDVFIPEIVDLSSVFSGVETGGASAVVSNLNQVSQNLTNGSLTLSDFQQSITYNQDENPGDDSQDPTEAPSPTEENPDSGDGSEDNGESDNTQVDGTFANFPVLNFLSRLGQLLQDIFDGNLLGVKNFFEPFLKGIRQDISDFSSIAESGFQDVIENGQSIIDFMQDILEQNQEQNQLSQEIQQAQNDIIQQGFDQVSQGVGNVLSNLFVPSEGFLEGKINDLRKSYAFADSIALTATDMERFLTSLGSVPPVIRINLGAATGSYNYGGDMVLVDFSFYEPYKPQMDAILSAFLWLWFCWRMILNLPGIISGASGIAGAFIDSGHVGSSGSAGFMSAGNIPSSVSLADAGKTSPSLSSGGSGVYDKLFSGAKLTPQEDYRVLLDVWHDEREQYPEWTAPFGDTPSYEFLKIYFDPIWDDQ